jgi:DNA polymerase-1
VAKGMRYLVLDFETRDPYLGKDIELGPGWVYAVHVPTSLFKVLGFSYHFIDDGIMYGSAKYLKLIPQELEFLKRILKESDAVVMHNAQYDLGCLRALGIDIKDLVVYDTKIIGHLYDNNLMSYSLDALSKKYLSEDQGKKKGSLVDVVKKHQLLKTPSGTPINPETETYERRAMKWAYENMDVIQEIDFKAMAYYATQDVIATGNLFLHFIKKVPLEQARYFSRFQLICTVIREKGLRIDMEVIRKGMAEMKPRLDQLEQELYADFGGEFNLNSPAQLTPRLLEKGYELPKTLTGRDSSNKDWLVLNKHDPLINKLLKYREILKIYRDFFEKTLDMQKYTCPEALAGERYGMVYPELNVFGARTGRFSSSCPNIQQIPKRSAEFGALTRSMFVPNGHHDWLSLDWSNQEGRLQIHYASMIGASGIDTIVKEFNDDPYLDIHQKVAFLIRMCCADKCGQCTECKDGRKAAKTINLGLSYGMSEAKLCKGLGLPTKKVIKKYRGKEQEVEVAGTEGKKILASYYTLCPYLPELIQACKDKIVQRGFIQTIGGRKVYREMVNGESFDYKSLNKLIQGSAADQCLAALASAYDSGLDIKCVVHDEINIEGTLEDAKKLKNIMENVLHLNIPMVTEVSVGKSWGTLTEVK